MNTKKEDFIKIEQAMISELHLSGNDLVIFAFVNGFTKGAEHIYRGGLDYLCKRTGVSRRTAINVLEKLTEEGLLTKSTTRKGKMTYCTYATKWCKTCTSAEPTPMQDLPESSANIASVSSENIAPKKKVENKSNRERSLSSKAVRDESYIPTIPDIEAYKLETNSEVDAERFFNFYDATGWITSNGLPIKNWKRLFDNWTKSERRKTNMAKAVNTEPTRKVNPCQDYYDYINSQNRSN